MAKKKVDCTELERAIADLAMSIGADESVQGLDDVVAEIQRSFPVMPREEIVNALVNATTGQAREIDELTRKLEQIKNQARRESEPRRKATLEKQIAEYERRIAESDIGPKGKPPELPQSKELERMMYDRDRLRQKVRLAVMNLKPKSIWWHIADPFNAIRAIKTSFDFSAVFRQGGFIVLGHPVRGAKALPDMFRAFIDPMKAAKINAELLERPNAPLYARSKLYIAPTDGSEALAEKEEAFMSRLAEHIPGVAASQRAYVTFLNVLRADSFDTMAATLAKNGEPTLQEAQAIATFINEATGRGSLASLEKAAVGLNTVFFAPKYTVSRFQMLLGHPLWHGTAETRKLIAGEYARYLIGLGTVLLLGALAGGEIEPDPRSADFLKLRFRNTRLDLLSGFSQVITLASRIITGETKSTTTGKVTTLRGEDVPYRGDTTWDVIGRFLRSKFSPTIGIPIDVVTGENVVGEKVTPASAALEAPVPMQFDDIYKAMKEQGIPEGAALSILSIFGMGLQTYGKKQNRVRSRE
jgi:hypothetical protein